MSWVRWLHHRDVEKDVSMVARSHGGDKYSTVKAVLNEVLNDGLCHPLILYLRQYHQNQQREVLISLRFCLACIAVYLTKCQPLYSFRMLYDRNKYGLVPGREHNGLLYFYS
uniref:Uncharacterized protein n=1 Tax=Cacopsylla melanoneura TaxID=428564 RepID=A0A8D8LWD7_9HEMI